MQNQTVLQETIQCLKEILRCEEDFYNLNSHWGPLLGWADWNAELVYLMALIEPKIEYKLAIAVIKEAMDKMISDNEIKDEEFRYYYGKLARVRIYLFENSF